MTIYLSPRLGPASTRTGHLFSSRTFKAEPWISEYADGPMCLERTKKSSFKAINRLEYDLLEPVELIKRHLFESKVCSATGQLSSQCLKAEKQVAQLDSSSLVFISSSESF